MRLLHLGWTHLPPASWPSVCPSPSSPPGHFQPASPSALSLSHFFFIPIITRVILVKMAIENQIVILFFVYDFQCFIQNIEDSFEAKKKAGAVFVDLTAAYDTVCHRGLTCKLLRLLPDKHMVKMIMELVRNQSFTLITGDSKQSRLSGSSLRSLQVLKTAFFRDRSWLPSYLTSIRTIFLP